MSDDRITVVLYNPVQAKREMDSAFEWVKPMTFARHRLLMSIRKETRSVKQNRVMWSCLKDISRDVTWFGKKMTDKGWKSFITAHLSGQELVPNMDGTGFIAINEGSSTSDMTIKEMIAVIDLCHAFGSEKGVKWSATSLGRDEFVDPDTGEIFGADGVITEAA